MAIRGRNPFWGRSLQRTLSAITRGALRAGSKAMAQALRPAAPVRKRGSAKSSLVKRKAARRSSPRLGIAPRNTAQRPAAKPSATATAHWSIGVAAGAAGPRRYRLYKPGGVARTERLPLLVMLHGCAQDAQALADVSQMNRIAAREHFFVLYPEQDRLSNAQACWNWYDTRSGRAQREASSVEAAILQVCLLQAVDPRRVVLAGLSAGASMAALLATRRPERFAAIAMHSGIAPGVAHSSATALSAMRGRRLATGALAALPAGSHLPPLLVIHGGSDPIVAPRNGAEAARSWAALEGAKARAPRTIQRGARYAATVTDYRARGRLVATHCEIKGLGHAWSGGAAGRSYSDPKGPDASRMIWTFAARQFRQTQPVPVASMALGRLA